MIHLDPARDETACCFIGTTAAIIAAIGAATAAGASVYGAKKQADTAQEGAQLQAHANDQALDFTRQQAQYQAQSDEVNRHANYDQWAAKRRYQGSIGQMLGLGGADVPAYVPGVTPQFTAPPSMGAMVDNPYTRSRLMPGAPGAQAAPIAFGPGMAGGTPAPGAMAGGPPMPPNPTGNLGPFANDWTPRDPRTGALLRPRLLSIGDYAA